MNRQTFALLDKLLETSGVFYTYQELADEMDVSVRTIRNYVFAINQFLQKTGLVELETGAGGTIGFAGSRRQANEARRKVLQSSFYHYRLSPQEREELIRLILLDSDDYVTVSDLSAILYVSKGTLVRDIANVEAYFSTWGVRFFPAPSKGYKLDIDEDRRRDLLVRNVRSLLGGGFALTRPASICDHFIRSRLQLDKCEQSLEQAITGMEGHYGIQLEDHHFQQLVLCLAVYVKRISAGAVLNMDTHMASQLEGSVYVEVAAYLYEFLQSQDFTVPIQERIYLAQKLKSQEMLGQQGGEDIDLEIHITVKSFFYSVLGELGIPAAGDNEMAMLFARHIQESLKRRMRGMRDVNHYKDGYMKQHPHIYEVVCRHIKILRTNLSYGEDDDEVSFALLHILAAVERFYSAKAVPRVIVVCNTGLGTANYLTERLRRSFKVEIAATTTSHRLPSILQSTRHDLIITTVPLDLGEVFSVQVSPVLHAEDMQQIQQALEQANRVMEHNAAPPSAPVQRGHNWLSSCLTPEYLGAACPAKDWRDAIVCAGTLLTKNGRASPQYIQEMIRTVEKHGPYIVFVPGVALAHAQPPQDCVGYSASLIRLTHPVEFGHPQNDPVRYVLAVHTANTQEHLQTMFQAMDMMCDQVFRRQLDAAANEEEMYRAIKAYEHTEPNRSIRS